MPTPPAGQTPLAQISPAQRDAVVRRVLRKPVVAPLDVAAFSSAI